MKYKFRFSIGTLLLLIFAVAVGLVWFDRFRLIETISELQAERNWESYLQRSLDNREEADVAMSALDVEDKLHQRAFRIIRNVEFNTIWSEDSPDDDVVRQIRVDSLPQLNLYIFTAQASRHRYRSDVCVILMDGQDRIVDIEILESNMQLELLNAAIDESDGVPSLIFTYNTNNNRNVVHRKEFNVTRDGFDQQ